MMLVVTISAMGQATSLVVDNQTPGWLSSKINYGDQQTVENLKVTGYINSTDIAFIGQLMSKQSLKGRLDLGEANIVGSTTDTDNAFSNNPAVLKGSLHCFVLPISLKSAKSVCDNIIVDTIYIGGPNLPNISSKTFRTSPYTVDTIIKCVILREGVSIVEENTFCANQNSEPLSKCVLSRVVLPSTLKMIGKYAFYGCPSLKDVNLPDSINYIGFSAFFNDSIFDNIMRLPKQLKKYDMSSLLVFGQAYETVSGDWVREGIMNRAEFYIPESVDTISIHGGIELQDTVIWHIANPTPPTFDDSWVYNYAPSDYINLLKVYVPKGCVPIYKNTKKIWKDLNIFEEPNPAKNILLDKDTLSLQKGHIGHVTAAIIPTDADSQTISWYSADKTIANVDTNGNVSAITSGSTYIYVCLTDNPSLKDSCLVTVYQPVTGLQLNNFEKEIKVGESFNLITTISPYDADDKSVIWQSENDSIATVVDGKVTGVKAGVVAIKAISASNSDIVATCEVTVLQPVEGIRLDRDNYTLGEIGDTVQLTATVLPEDASNKKVNWRSSSESVCIVSNGKVVATGYGTAIVIATTADGGYMATCTIKVDSSATGIDNIVAAQADNYEIYDVTGKRLSSLRSGINIIKLPNGKVKKIVIK